MEKTEGESPPSKTCGSCRRVGTDLKICTACRSVHYCDVSCQKAHRKAHKDDCKEIAHAKEVMEEFKANLMTEECPICMMRLPMLPDEFYYHPCCGKTICHGCIAASRKAQGVGLTDPDPPCAFCRRPMASSPEELFGRINERINKHGDAMAVFTMGTHHREGSGVPKDDRNAFECDVKVSQMGNPHGMYNVAGCYMSGTGVPMDKKKARTYLEMAASNGHVGALVQLGQTYKKRIDKYQTLHPTYLPCSREWARTVNGNPQEGVPLYYQRHLESQ